LAFIDQRKRVMDLLEKKEKRRNKSREIIG